MAKVTNIMEQKIKTGRAPSADAIIEALQLVSVLQATEDITKEICGVMACMHSTEELSNPKARQPLEQTAKEILGNDTLYNLGVYIGLSIDMLEDLKSIVDGMTQQPKAQRLQELQEERTRAYQEYAKQQKLIICEYLEASAEVAHDRAQHLKARQPDGEE